MDLEVRGTGMQRCSPSVRALGVDPIGSAGTRTGFLLVDHPLPWTREVSEDPLLVPVAAALRSAAGAYRLQAVVPLEGAPTRRLVRYSLPHGPFTRFDRSEVVVEQGEVAEAARALLAGPVDPTPDGRGDLLVCTHGRRDACCGSSGTSLWQDVVVRPELLGEHVRLCRTSHTGGHRFAPTAIDLPSGTCWAWLDVDVLGRILRREGEPGEVSGHYRGSYAYATVEEQVVDRAVLEQVGWAWLDRARSGAVVARDGDRSEVELVDHAEGGAWRAETRVTGRAPVPECPGRLDEAPKHAPVVEVVAGSLRFVRF